MTSADIDFGNRLDALSALGNAVIIGSNGGIGQALVGTLLAKAQFESLFCLNRNRQTTNLTPDIAAPPTRLIGLHIDLTQEDAIAHAAQQVSLEGPVSLVLVATGMLHDGEQTPEKTMRHLSSDALLRAFHINAVGPALVAKHFLPLMTRDGPSVFAALSARVGSISDNRSGGWYSYRASKAALNMLIQTLALEHARKFPLGVCVGIHPGTVDTNLSKPFQSGVPGERLFSPDLSAAHILKLITQLTAAHSGGLYAWDGARIAP
jgi:NAD(P)-dependent dehydrogenase (short-subunit alcohol dehydrogenase family)